MLKNIRYVMALLAGLVLTTVSCQRDETDISVSSGIPDGYMTLSFAADVPAMTEVETRAVDPDGGGVQHIVLYCFDAYGIFITSVTVDNEDHYPDAGNPSMSGSFRAIVPDYTSFVHIVGNQNLTNYAEDAFRNKSEFEVMSALEASTGRMIYWAKKTVEELKEHTDRDNPVQLLRNQAKVTVEVAAGTSFIVKGFVVVNTSSFGTVAPYHPESGFIAPSSDNPFVTLTEDRSKLGDYLDVRGNLEEYVFETENSLENPVSVIIKGSWDGGEDKYYRVMMIDEAGEQVMLLRNHHYRIVISGELSYGQETFGSALTAVATNNVWITVEDHVKEIYGLEYVLAVDQTDIVIDESEFLTPNTRLVHYTVRRIDGSALTAEDKPEVTWLDGNTAAYQAFLHDFDPSTGRGVITVTLQSLGADSKKEGTLMIKKGRLYRKVKIVTLKKQSFVPAWVSTQVYGHQTGEHLTMMFTISDECPEELFPLEVLVSTNILDIRHESGQELPVRLATDEGWYGEANGWGYKYVFTATGPGKQRLYLENILVQTGESSVIKIEAEHFEPLSKTFTFASEASKKAILLDGLLSYSAVQPADEPIYYYLVPPKVNAHVMFDTHLGELSATEPADGYDTIVNHGGESLYVKYIAPGEADEFLFYSKYLSHDPEKTSQYSFTFYPINEGSWGTGGRVFGFKRNTDGTQGTGATCYMVTNASRSEELVRISSNPKGVPSVVPPHTGLCSGEQYRSVLFELANHRPFRFYASVSRGGTTVVDDGIDMVIGTGTTREEAVEELSWEYVPAAEVDICFDLTSYTGNDGRSVDPFGETFEVYVDAPMLEIDRDRLPASWLASANPSLAVDKLREAPSVAGRFIYTVDASREAERSFGAAGMSVVRTDAGDVDGDGAADAVDQSGERKSLPFKVKDIVSAGKIRVSSQEEKVVYYSKTFNVTNRSMTGRLMYGPAGAGVDDAENVPAEAFVVLERIRTYNRIGTVTVSEADAVTGENFAVRLRSEYNYGWDTDDPVKIQYAKPVSGSSVSEVYEAEFANLAALYAVMSSGTPVILSLK